MYRDIGEPSEYLLILIRAREENIIHACRRFLILFLRLDSRSVTLPVPMENGGLVVPGYELLPVQPVYASHINGLADLG